MKKLKMQRIRVYSLISLILVFMILSLAVYMAQHNRDKVVKNMQDAAYTSSFYLTSDPHVEGPYYGNEKAGITLIAFTDTSSEASRSFARDIFPLLDKDYIKADMLKFYHKNYITLQDIK